MAPLSFTIGVERFNRELLPPNAQSPGTAEFRNAVTEFLAREFKNFGGHATFMVDDRNVSVSWNPDRAGANPLEAITAKLQRGQRAEAIQLLELLLSHKPSDVNVLYNLGMALSDFGKLPNAEAHLRRALELAPSFTNARIALAVALARQGKDAESIDALETAVSGQPNNIWAQLNLGILHLKVGNFTQAAACLQRVTAANPDNQRAGLAYGDALRHAGDAVNAESAYGKVLALDPHSDLAEMAREGSSRLAQASFHAGSGDVPRPDAVDHCLAALQTFSKMSDEQVKQVGLELALAGRNGMDVNSPEPKYQVKGLEGSFTGLRLVSFLYVAMQRIAPGESIGFDLSEEYGAAMSLFYSG
jgi:Flp pilus assembly protein TadD